MKSLMVVASRTNKTKTFVPVIKDFSESELVECYDFSISPSGFDKIIFGSYTWSDGKIPKKMKDYLIKYHQELKGKDIFIFGSGLTVYHNFCGALDGIRKICEDSKANVRYLFRFELRYNEENFDPDVILELKQELKNFFKD